MKFEITNFAEVVLKANTGADAIKRAPIVNYDSGLRCLRIQDISQNKPFEQWGFSKVSEADLKRFLLKKDDLIIARTGATIGVNLIIRSNLHAVFNNGLIRIKTNKDKCFPAYLSYILSESSFASYMDNVAKTTSTQPNIKIDVLLNYQFPLPPLPTQKKIAAVLSAYDDLIENNTRRIALLERMAEELYKEWFLRMRFPGHEQARFVKGIPEGWEVKTLGEITSLLNRGISPKYDDESSSLVINQKCIRDGKIDLAFAKYHSSQVQLDKIIRFGDTLINSTGVGTLGRAAIATEKEIGLTVDSHVTICRVKPELANNLYLGYTLRFLQNYFEYMAVGATGQVELLASFLKKTKILLPDCATQSKFGSIALHLINQQTKLAQANLILKQTRDRLLTRLISGKLSVEDLDIAFPPSMLEEA